jgi:hypothetical protein
MMPGKAGNDIGAEPDRLTDGGAKGACPTTRLDRFGDWPAAFFFGEIPFAGRSTSSASLAARVVVSRLGAAKPVYRSPQLRHRVVDVRWGRGIHRGGNN